MTETDQGGHPSSPPHQNEPDTANDNNDHHIMTSDGVPTPLYYSDHIANVCEAVNAEQKAVYPPYDMSQADRRRVTNRLSARRCRQRKKGELEQMELDFRRLTRENESLTAEKAQLEQELLHEKALCRESLLASTSVARVPVERPIQTHMKAPPTQATLPQQQPYHPKDLKSGGFAPLSGRIGNLLPSMFQGTDPYAQFRMSGFQGINALHHANSALLEAATLESLRSQNFRLALLPTNPFLLTQVETQLAPSEHLGYQTNGISLSFSDPALYMQWLQARNQQAMSSSTQPAEPAMTASTSSDVRQRPDRNALG